MTELIKVAQSFWKGLPVQAVEGDVQTMPWICNDGKILLIICQFSAGNWRMDFAIAPSRKD